VGQQLIIPRAPALPEVDNPAAAEVIQVDREPLSAGGAGVAAATVVAVKGAPAQAQAPAARVHRVKRGDTLFSIARLYRTTVSALKSWNQLRTDSIQVGQRLRIFNEHASTATN